MQPACQTLQAGAADSDPPITSSVKRQDMTLNEISLLRRLNAFTKTDYYTQFI